MTKQIMLLSGVENCTDCEQHTANQEGDVHTLLQDLDMPIRSLIDLARVVDRTQQPQNRGNNKDCLDHGGFPSRVRMICSFNGHSSSSSSHMLSQTKDQAGLWLHLFSFCKELI
ncbi:Hypothetical predicted protein [Prunus dulcis]|uniref:Uncharacterized protein n=1 Tax=Prunus dulcis TaxID=3755 RepID=A0A5E4GLK8_PRUDU|nr:Hypothetical predicted protein [Prunus dulcis]